MANKIVPGTTGQASIVETIIEYNDYIVVTSYPYTGSWNIHGEDSVGGSYYTTLNASYDDKHGWEVTSTGLVTIPATEDIGSGDGRYYTLVRETTPEEKALHGNKLYRFESILLAFDVACMTVALQISKLSSSKVPSSSPIQYTHKYAVEAKTQGGLKPYTYNWSSSVGTLNASGPTCTLTVTNSDPNSGGVTGTVSCTVTDSNSTPCEAEAEFSLADANASIEGCGPCVLTPSGTYERQCSCDAGKCPPCAQPTGNLTESGGSSDPQSYSNYGLRNSSQPTSGVLTH